MMKKKKRKKKVTKKLWEVFGEGRSLEFFLENIRLI